MIVFGDVSGLEASDEKVAVEKSLTGIYGTNTWFYKARSAADVLEELKKDYEICHFVGHGEFHADHPSETGWKFSDGSVLTCHDIEAVSSRAAFPLLIFANSCDSARPAIPDAQGYITTLYRSFLRQGVPHYIGTAARIPDNLSNEFALCFYQMLATGSSVGEALGEARRLFSAEPGIPIWAYYIHYGDPTYRFLDRKTRTSGYENAPATGGPKILRDTTSFSVLGRSSNDEIGRTLEHYKSVITKNSADGEAHYALALCHLQLGLPELAIKNFQRTVELMPDCADDLLLLRTRPNSRAPAEDSVAC